MFAIDPVNLDAYQADPSAYFQNAALQLRGLLAGERDWVTNCAQFSAFVYQQFPRLNWAGFYLPDPSRDNSLLLGPFQGKVACIHIPYGKGVCGTAAITGEIQLVRDVGDFDGHIACDPESRSELAIPIRVDGQLRAVLDLDSPDLERFDEGDRAGMAALADVLVDGTDWSR